MVSSSLAGSFLGMVRLLAEEAARDPQGAGLLRVHEAEEAVAQNSSFVGTGL